MLAIVNEIQGVSAENNSISCMARIVAQKDGSYPAISAFLSASYTVTDTSTFPATTVTTSTPLSPISSHFYSFPIVTSAWTYDDIGYNFSFSIPINTLTNFNHAYVITVTVVDVNSNNFTINFRNITRASS